MRHVVQGRQRVEVLAGGKHALSMSSRVTRRRAVFKLRQRCCEGDEGIALTGLSPGVCGVGRAVLRAASGRACTGTHLPSSPFGGLHVQAAKL